MEADERWRIKEAKQKEINKLALQYMDDHPKVFEGMDLPIVKVDHLYGCRFNFTAKNDSGHRFLAIYWLHDSVEP